MANFPGLVLTQNGRDLQAKAQIGAALTFTRVALGDGETSAPDAMSALDNELLSLSIQDFEVVGDGTSRMRVIMTNESLDSGFFVRELGVYAEDPDTGEEQLYSYTNAGDQPDFLPAGGGATLVENVFDLYTVVGNAQNVTAKINDYITIATKQDIDVIRPYILPKAGLAGQQLRKVSNDEGDAEWFDPDEGINVRIHSITERRVAVAEQTVFNLRETRTDGLAIYVSGARLAPNEWQALNVTQVQLDEPLAADTVVQFVNNEEVGVDELARVSLVGPDLVYPDSSNTYTITDFDGFSAYTVGTNVGTASRTDDTITLDVPLAAEEGSLTLTVTRNNGSASFVVAVGAQTVAAPEVLNPANGATEVGETPTLTSSAFATYPSESDSHASTDWQISNASDFSTILWESLSDNANLESIQVPNGTLATSTTYYVRARHNGSSLGASDWSAVVSFTTDTQFVPESGSAGEPYGGGYFVSRMYDTDGVTEYALIISEKAGGQSSEILNNEESEIFVNNLSLNGYADWVLPDIHEARAIYWNLKPTTQDNDTGHGASNRIIPNRNNYTTSNPSRTNLTAFRATNSESIYNGSSATRWIQTSTGVYPSDVVWLGVEYGGETEVSKTSNSTWARAVRRVYL